MRETQIKSKIAKELRSYKSCYVITLSGSEYQTLGMPDLLIIKDGIHIWIECKGPDTPTKGHQKRVHQQMQEQGVHVYMLYFYHDDEWMIDNFYRIQGKTFDDRVKMLYDTLLSLSQPQLAQDFK